MLVEVIATVSVVAMIGLGLFLGIEGASHGSSNNKQRSIAAALAQQDQDRMRAFRATDLSNYDETNTITVAGVPYTVHSTGNWVSDSSGSIGCSNASSKANYLKISSSVRWSRMRIKPVRLESLVAPPPGSFNASQGNLVVQLTDQANGPVPGVPVSLGSPSNATKSTEAEGCAVFGALTAGSYNLSFSKPGYVNPDGQNEVTDEAQVVASTTSTKPLQYALAGAIAVSFDTQVGSSSPQPSRARTLTLQHSGVGDGIRDFNPTGGAQSMIQATNLFPFATGGYGVYAGSCTEANPVHYDETYFNNNPGLVTVTPGGSHAVTVRQPALNVRVTRNGAPLENARVFVTATDSGCGGTFPAQQTNANGTLPEPGYPFGHYSICADDGVGGRSVTRSNVASTTPGGTNEMELAIPPDSSQGTQAACA